MKTKKAKSQDSYNAFLAMKEVESVSTGLSRIPKINPMLYDFQRDITKWSLKRGRSCIFADCGLGKTPMQLEWAKHIPGRVLIVAPLAVSQQTVREGVKFGVEVTYARSMNDIVGKITITNYEMLEKFDSDYFEGIVLDESSILKSYTGKFRNMIIEKFSKTRFKLACTATPAPNDYMELGNHAEFMGVMTREEMLAMFFVHDGGETQKWRLKGHATTDFWKWMCSWAIMIRQPSDLGYDNKGFVLPELKMTEIVVSVDHTTPTPGSLFRIQAETLQQRQKERKLTVRDRVSACAKLANASDEPWLIWCNLNDESAALKSSLKDAVEIKGADKQSHKVDSMLGFSEGDVRVLVTKPKIAGFGMNWQHCNNVVFVGLSDSYEQFYQAVRRCWRFGQTKQVNCYIITAETEGAVVANIKRKEVDAMRMAEGMVQHMHVYNEKNIKGTARKDSEYMEAEKTSENWTAYLGDCVEMSEKIGTDSVHYTVFSPPFASLYTYTDSQRDMGNSKNNDDFNEHFGFLVKELYRATMPGRLVSFHCMNLPTSKTRDGHIGIRDFRGDLIDIFVKAGFYYHSEVCIWKDPVVAVTRTKALGLLHKQMTKDSCMCRQGLPDYVVTMRKPGDNPERVAGELSYFCGDKSTFEHKGKLSIDIWQKYASPVWMDINPSNTLQKTSARAEKDERHICPLQLDVIERCLQLWSNEGDLVFSPFMGIASEGYVALKLGRRFVGVELKQSYYDQAVKNLERMENEIKSGRLF